MRLVRTGRHRLKVIVGVMQRSDALEIRDLRDDFIAILVGEGELLIQPGGGCRIRSASMVPACPQSIDVAVMHPKERFVSSPGDAAHSCSTVSHQHVHATVQSEIQVLIEARLHSAR